MEAVPSLLPLPALGEPQGSTELGIKQLCQAPAASQGQLLGTTWRERERQEAGWHYHEPLALVPETEAFTLLKSFSMGKVAAGSSGWVFDPGPPPGFPAQSLGWQEKLRVFVHSGQPSQTADTYSWNFLWLD